MSTLMDQLAQMALDAGTMKQEASAASEKLNKKVKNIRRKSRDLEQDFFGKFAEEAKADDEAFEDMDTDKSGAISASELKEAIKKVQGAEVPPDHVFKNMIEKFADQRAKGAPETAPFTEVSKTNFRKLIAAIKAKEFDQFATNEAELELKRIFAATDVDDSGTISKAELGTALKSGDLKFEPNEEQWKQIMKYAKEKPDGDGIPQEFSIDDFCKLVSAIKLGHVK